MTAQVLIIDPHKSNRTVLKLLLSREQVLCDEVSFINDASHLIMSNNYDAVFCCASLAGPDLNAFGREVKLPLFVMVTPEQKARLGNIDYGQFLLKPLIPSRVAEKLHNYLPHRFAKKRSAI